jgi:hypothetical protein
MLQFDWDSHFDPAYGVITMPANRFAYYRGYKTIYPTISSRPSYYGSIVTARGYTSGADTSLSAFTNTKPLKLLDVRCMKDILRELFATHAPDDETLSVVLSFGLCSLDHQCFLAKQRYTKNAVMQKHIRALIDTYEDTNHEQPGVRIAETNNDAFTMAFLKELFSDFVDGFISPRMYSAFHIERQDRTLSAEMILFNPIKSGVRKVNESEISTKTVSFEYLYGMEFGKKISFKTYGLYLRGGGEESTHLPTVEEIAECLENRDPNIQAQWDRGTHVGKRWKSIAQFGLSEPPKPIAKVHPWSSKKKTRKSYASSRNFSNPHA